MRRVLALALGLCLWAVPALAGYTQVAGTGTGNALANLVIVGTTSGSCGTTTASLNAGDLWVVVMQDSNTGSPRTYGVSDAFGNTWQAAPGKGDQNGAGTEVWYSVITNPVASGNHATCTTSQAAGFFATNLAFRPATAGAFDTNSTGQASSGTTVSLGPTPTLACPGGGANCDVCIGGAGWHSASGTALDAAWTATFAGGGGNVVVNGFKFYSSATTSSQTDTNGVSANYAGALACFKDTVASSSTYGGLTTTGAGP